MAAAIATVGATAQEKPVFGLKAGVNVADWKVDGVDNDALDSRIGFHIGLLSHIHVAKSVALQPEIQYSTQGAKNASNDDVYKVDYINVPIMLQYMFNNGFRIEAGPQFGLLVTAKDEQNNVSIDAKDDYKKGDVGIGLGLNYLSYSGFGVGGRYTFGVADINDAGANSIKNRVLQVSLFYMFDRNHKAKSR
ncbi:MAG: PorT family protein [Flaviaesturariibacter sp.]|nr:PorT family protein [Flaviaesturariibacter sp.]